MLRWLTAGESHGPALVAILEGMPAGVQITSDSVSQELGRRRLGYGRGARQKFEQDQLSILGGVRHGVTQGGPIAMQIANSEWPKWTEVMNPDPVPQSDLDGLARAAPLTRPRPGHADLVGMQKYGFEEARPVLERASARETAARVALGAVAKAFLRQALDVVVFSHVVEIGTVSSHTDARPTTDDLPGIDADPVRCFDPDTSAAMVAEIDAAKKDGDTLGGVVEVLAYGLPPGLGSHVQVGDGFTLARTRGSLAQDEIVPGQDGVSRVSDHAGGTEGGMTTGEPLRVRAAMKPISTVPRALRTIDTSTGEAATAHNQRSDACAVPAAAVIAEAMVSLVLADAVLEKFGGDSAAETARNVASYLEHLHVR